jgi:hypothetical protein
MEESPLFPTPEDDNDDAKDNKSERKLPSFSKLINSLQSAEQQPDKPKYSTAEAIVRSVLGRTGKDEASEDTALNQDRKEDKIPDLISESDSVPETDQVELTYKEETAINREIAEEHLVNPVVEGQPSSSVNEFLGRVVEGVDPDEAFKLTAEANQSGGEPAVQSIESSGGSTAITETPLEDNSEAYFIDHSSDPADSEEKAVDIENEGADQTLFELPSPVTLPNVTDKPRIYTADKTETNTYTAAHKEPSRIARTLIKSLSERRDRSKSSKAKEKPARTKTASNPVQVTPLKVAQMEQQLTRQENTLQQLSREALPKNSRIDLKPNPKPEEIVDKPTNLKFSERTLNPSNPESRLKLVKPERAGRIGKVLVGKEEVKTVPKAQPNPKPEEIVDKPTNLKFSERTLNPSNPESRLKLVKPERAGRIGKVLVDQERVSNGKTREITAGEKPSDLAATPDQAGSMLRTDLLRLSDKITVEGASLRHMYENHLFGEGALRRLVQAHLSGKELLPLVKREIIERQIDFERDPILRDKFRPGYTDNTFTGKILNSPQKSSEHGTSPVASKTYQTAATADVRIRVGQARRKPWDTILALTITSLVVLIIYLLVR